MNAPTFEDIGQYYVPRMSMSSILSPEMTGYTSLGTPKALDPDGILDGGSLDNNTSAFSVTTKGTTASATVIASYTTTARYGQAVVVKTATGTTARVVYVWGRDYLNQLMVEKFTTSATTGASVQGNKAFKHIDKVTAPQAAGAITVDIGWTNRVGVPFKIRDIKGATEGSDQVDIKAGSFVLPDTTDPATDATKDPRGLYIPVNTLGGSEIIIDLRADASVNASDNGGLHGIAHARVTS